ncbi:MAG: hypothetical protein AAB492_05120 [Patescibacteria group bacterium]
MNSTSVATLISSIFEPMVVVYALAILAGIRVGESHWYFGYIALLVVVGIIARLYFKLKDKTNWDISDRKKRIVPLLFLVGILCIQMIVIMQFNNVELISLYWMFLWWVVGFFLLTLKIKVSGHLSILTLAVCQFIWWYGNSILWLVLFIPLLSWSRVLLKRHTIREVIVGICYSSIVFLWLN